MSLQSLKYKPYGYKHAFVTFQSLSQQPDLNNLHNQKPPTTDKSNSTNPTPPPPPQQQATRPHHSHDVEGDNDIGNRQVGGGGEGRHHGNDGRGGDYIEDRKRRDPFGYPIDHPIRRSYFWNRYYNNSNYFGPGNMVGLWPYSPLVDAYDDYLDHQLYVFRGLVRCTNPSRHGCYREVVGRTAAEARQNFCRLYGRGGICNGDPLYDVQLPISFFGDDDIQHVVEVVDDDIPDAITVAEGARIPLQPTMVVQTAPPPPVTLMPQANGTMAQALPPYSPMIGPPPAASGSGGGAGGSIRMGSHGGKHNKQQHTGKRHSNVQSNVNDDSSGGSNNFTEQLNSFMNSKIGGISAPLLVGGGLLLVLIVMMRK